MVIILARNWWAMVLRGVLDVLFGIAAFAWPGITLAVLAILYGAFALVDGCFAIAAAVVGRPRGMPWWALLVEGVLVYSLVRNRRRARVGETEPRVAGIPQRWISPWLDRIDTRSTPGPIRWAFSRLRPAAPESQETETTRPPDSSG